jgi:type II secretory pathway component PulF
MSVAAGLKNAPFFPEYARNMIAVGEESGRIEESLKDVAQYYEREVDRRVVVATSLIEPILILVVGAIVGFIALAMMLPVFAITRAIS